MIFPPSSLKVFVASAPVDFRKAFDGLAALVRETLLKDPFSGHLYVFRNRSGDRVKILFWDRGGYSLYYKRLEQGVFHFPAEGGCVEIDAADLTLLLEGIELAGSSRRPRWHPAPL
jgi:transposase